MATCIRALAETATVPGLMWAVVEAAVVEIQTVPRVQVEVASLETVDFKLVAAAFEVDRESHAVLLRRVLTAVEVVGVDVLVIEGEGRRSSWSPL